MTTSTSTFKESMTPGVGTRVETSTIAGLVDYLSPQGRLPAPVIDKTGLKGDYDIKMEILARGLPPREPGAPLDLNAIIEAARSRLFAAVEKLGLKLERQKNQVATIIVEHVERTPTEN